MELQKRLVELRIERRLSQEELAEKLYVSRQTISNWERGKTYPDISSLLLIATYFDVSLDYLLKGDVDEMKHHVSQSQLKKWLILSGIFFFIFSVIFPTRFLIKPNIFWMLAWLTGLPLLYSIFQVFHILTNENLKTFTDIISFFEGKKRPFNLSREIAWSIGLCLGAFFIFFQGSVVSAIFFYIHFLLTGAN